MLDKITSREYIFIAMFAVLTSKIMTLPHILYEYANTDAIFSCILNLLIEIVLVILITNIIKNNPDMTLFEFLSKKLTKIGAVILIITLSLFLFIKSIFLIQEIYTFLLNTIYDKFDYISYYIPTFFIIGYIATKGSKTLGKCLEIFGFFVAGGLLIAFINVIGLLPLDINTPYLKDGLNNTFSGSIHSAFYIGNSLPLLFFVGKVKTDKHLIAKTLLGTSIIAIFVTVMNLCFFNILGYTAIFSTFALSDLSQYNPYVSDLGHLNWLSIIVSTINLLSITSIMYYALGEGAKQIFKIKSPLIPILIYLIIAFLIGYLLHFDLRTFEIIITKHIYFVIGILLIVLLLMLIILNFRRKTNAKNSFE